MHGGDTQAVPELTSRQLLRALLTIVGMVAAATGIFAVLTGANGMPGEIQASASVESELRFFAVFWIAYGVVALRTAPRVELETTTVRALALAMFVAGLARAVAWIAVGRPHSLFVALMIVELIGPPLVVVWQARVARSSSQVDD